MCDTKEKEYSVSELEIMLEIARMKREITAMKSSFQSSTPATAARVTQVIHPSIGTSRALM